jgi:RNA polymerase sigma-70 factor (ECF subfamily)
MLMCALSRRSSHKQVTPPMTVERFEVFYARQYRGVMAFAYALTGNRSQAEDLTQEAFLSAFVSWSSIQEPDAWVRTVVSNKAMTWWRRQYTARKVMVRMAQRDDGAPEISAEADAFWTEVRRLPSRQAQAITLFYLDDYPVSDISRVLGCSESTARTHLSRGRKALASRLGVEP